jgi:uncharacterized protein YecT (DUF1311 family)
MKATLLRLLLLAAICMLPMVSAHAQTQAQMNNQAFAEFKKADADLNKIYAKVMAKLDDEGKEKLKTAQRAWIAFRDAQAELDADVSRGGTMAPLLRSSSMTDSTQARIRQLQDYLKTLNNQ